MNLFKLLQGDFEAKFNSKLEIADKCLYRICDKGIHQICLLLDVLSNLDIDIYFQMINEASKILRDLQLELSQKNKEIYHLVVRDQINDAIPTEIFDSLSYLREITFQQIKSKELLFNSPKIRMISIQDSSSHCVFILDKSSKLNVLTLDNVDSIHITNIESILQELYVIKTKFSMDGIFGINELYFYMEDVNIDLINELVFSNSSITFVHLNSIKKSELFLEALSHSKKIKEILLQYLEIKSIPISFLKVLHKINRIEFSNCKIGNLDEIIAYRQLLSEGSDNNTEIEIS